MKKMEVDLQKCMSQASLSLGIGGLRGPLNPLPEL